MPRQNCNNPGTVLVINQNNGNEMCVTAMPEQNNNCPNLYIAGKASESNYIGCFKPSDSSNPSSSPSSQLELAPSLSKCGPYIESTANSSYTPPNSSNLSRSTIEYCRKSECKNNANKIIVGPKSSRPFICP